MKKAAALLLLLSLSLCVHAQLLSQYPIIPRPQTLLPLAGAFPLNSDVVIVPGDRSSDRITKKETHFFREKVKSCYGVDLRTTKNPGYKSSIFIWADSSGLPPGGYMMFINANDINIYGSETGIFYALESLFQLIQTGGAEPGRLMIPSCNIIDYPRFAWRGLHLDVARHFFPKEHVKEYLRYMAMYKLNTFHWHLTDDQGWRMEIKKYPLLTTIGAWRNATLIGHYSEEPDRYDSVRYGGFYTHDEIREVVRFADSLHITVVPEIEMPGHARALLAAYPALGSGDPQTKHEVAGTWGVFTEVMAPKEETFATLEGILDEVCTLFPGEYVHIGGDESPKDEWQRSAYCQQLIRDHHLKDEHGLQSWFVQRIVTYLGTKGKKAIGWDEILEGGLTDGAAVMSWRGEEGGIAAAKAHHNVVMTPVSHCYFDYYQSQHAQEPLAIGGYLPLEKVYRYDPVPAALNSEERKYIMGVQANLWTEYIPTFSQVQYMLFPRIAALAEIAWSPEAPKSYDDFLFRTIAHIELYGKMRVNYSSAIFDIQAHYTTAPGGNGILLALGTLAPDGMIRYSFDSTVVTADDPLYTTSLLINSTREVRASFFQNGKKAGRDFVQAYRFHDAMGKNVTMRKAPSSSYNTGGALTLVDGITGRTPWTGSEWLGWWGDTMDVVIDLGKLDTIHTIRMITLEDRGSWIYSPTTLNTQFSVDGKTFTSAVCDEDARNALGGGKIEIERYCPTVARYVHIRISGMKQIPQGNPGAGYPAWLFVSEIIIE
jgi:hexosaminidase